MFNVPELRQYGVAHSKWWSSGAFNMPELRRYGTSGG
jgi:hypothetical protein